MKYELIKIYPGSPELGTIRSSENKISEWQGTIFYDTHPTFWKKVEEVDYEITKVMYLGVKRFLHEGGYRIFKDDIGFELDCLLKNGGTIYSVKRKFDGEVFTVGDEINGATYTNREIKGFTLFGNSISISQRGGYSQLQDIKKVKKTPLFTTEDGVGIFEGDNYYYVTNDFILGNQICSKDHKEFTHNSKNFRFSTKEKAEEYILLNKLLLSLNDLLAVWGNAEHPEKSSLFKKFEELAKSKL